MFKNSFQALSRSNFHNQVLWLLVLNFTGSPIHPPLGALTRRLASDELPPHLMSPIHSTDGRRPIHPVGGVPVLSVGRWYAHAAAYVVLIITRTSPGKLSLHANATQTADTRAQGDCTGN
jgi:hypothetical protein